MHCILYAVYYTLYSILDIIYPIYSILYTNNSYSILCTVHSIFDTRYSILDTLHSTLYAPYYIQVRKLAVPLSALSLDTGRPQHSPLEKYTQR